MIGNMELGLTETFLYLKHNPKYRATDGEREYVYDEDDNTLVIIDEKDCYVDDLRVGEESLFKLFTIIPPRK